MYIYEDKKQLGETFTQCQSKSLLIHKSFHCLFVRCHNNKHLGWYVEWNMSQYCQYTSNLSGKIDIRSLVQLDVVTFASPFQSMNENRDKGYSSICWSVIGSRICKRRGILLVSGSLFVKPNHTLILLSHSEASTSELVSSLSAYQCK